MLKRVFALLVDLMAMLIVCRKVEKKPLANTASSTVDVDTLWANMLSGKPISSTKPAPPPETPTTENGPLSPTSARKLAVENKKDARSPSTLSDGPDSMIMIKRTYNFAGKVHTEQKLVARNSAEAKLFLASQSSTSDPPKDAIPDSPFTKPKRPVRKARRSAFEPIYDLPRRTDLHFGERKESAVMITGVDKDAKKLNTVEKSAMDWAGFVDKEGIADELDAAGKAKGAYKARQEFLARVEYKKDEEARRARGLPV